MVQAVSKTRTNNNCFSGRTQMKGNHHLRIALTALLGLGIISIPALAEDIEVFFSKEASTVAPNVLFVLLKDSLRNVLKPGEEYYKALNVGIMNFSGNRGGGIDFPVADINGDAHDIDPNIPAARLYLTELYRLR